MKITLPHIVTISDLFCNYDVDKLKGKGNIKRKYKCSDKKALVKKIFLRYLHIMITDLIEGGKVFLFPSRKYMEMKFRQIPPQQFKRARQSGAYREVDILKSSLKCYELVICHKQYGMNIQVPVKLSKNFIDRIIEKINTGYVYC